MATEEASRDLTTSKNKSDLEALSLNYLRSQNISAIPDDDHIPKLHPCKLCNKAIFGFNLEAFTVLNCRHIYHRICLEIHIIRGATKYPTCPTCKADIEIFREELALASDECGVLPKSPDKGIASQQSNVTIVDDGGGLGEMMALGLIVDDESSEKTKQVSKEDRGTSPTARENISVTQNGGASTAEKGTTNMVQVNSADQDNANESTTSPLKRPNPLASDNLQSTKKVKKSDEKKDESKTRNEVSSNVVKKLIDELSIETSQISEVNEESTGNFHDLYLAINRAEEQSECVNQLVIKSYYDFGKAFEERYEYYRKNNPKRTAQALVNKEVGKQLPDSVSETSLRKRK